MFFFHFCAWVQEASSCLPVTLPRVSVSVKQGSRAHQCFVWFIDHQDGEHLQGPSKFVRYVQLSGTVTVTVAILAGQFASTTPTSLLEKVACSELVGFVHWKVEVLEQQPTHTDQEVAAIDAVSETDIFACLACNFFNPLSMVVIPTML